MSQGVSYLRSMCLIYRGRSRARMRMKRISASDDQITKQDKDTFSCVHSPQIVCNTSTHFCCWSKNEHIRATEYFIIFIITTRLIIALVH